MGKQRVTEAQLVRVGSGIQKHSERLVVAQFYGLMHRRPTLHTANHLPDFTMHYYLPCIHKGRANPNQEEPTPGDAVYSQTLHSAS
ncbi:hypothetical protein GCM10010103_76780 [Streptomyces paradoxus]